MSPVLLPANLFRSDKKAEAFQQRIGNCIDQKFPRDRRTQRQASNASDQTMSNQKRRAHRKSKKGCLNCKRRKVKCDETTPVCSNCLRFDIPCSLNPLSYASQARETETGSTFGYLDVKPRHGLRRGPGRPRKDWTAVVSWHIQTPTSEPTPTLTDSAVSLESLPSSNVKCFLDVSDAELMVHYVHHTAITLCGLESADSRMAMFLKDNVLRLAFSHHYVLRLVYSLAAFHLAHSYGNESNEGAKYLFVAKSHLEIGLRQLNDALSRINESNCSAPYVSALLVSYCSFAAGPKSNNDLLVCDVGSEATRQLPLIHGVRLIRRAIEPAALFTGYLAPLAETSAVDEKPELLHKHVDWVQPVKKLQQWIKSFSDPHTTVFEQAVLSLSAVYKTLYGDQDDSHGCTSDDRLVFGWLYRLQDPFLVSIKEKQPLALVILAYYVPLLKALRMCWFLEGWPEHILSCIYDMLTEGQHKWLEWPLQVVKGLPRSL